MAFDPITYSAVDRLSVIGSVLQVSETFSDPRFLEGNTRFDPAEYPKLATGLSSGFNGDVYDAISVPNTMPQAQLASSNQFASNSIMFEYGGDIFFISSIGDIFRTTGGSLATFAFWKTLQTPLLVGAPLTSIAGRELNGFLYCNASNGLISQNLRIDLSDPTFETQAQLSGVPNSSSLRFAFGNGTYVAINSSASGQTVYSSTDGLTFVPRTAVYTASLIPADIDFGNGIFVIVTNGTSGSNSATSVDGITWTARTLGNVAQRFVRYSATAGIWVSAPVAPGGGFWSSADAVTWVSRAQGAPINTGQLLTFSVINGTFIATYSSWSGVACIQVSSNGTAWFNRAVTGNIAGPFGILSNSNRVMSLGSQIVILGSMGATGAAQMAIGFSNDDLATTSVVKLIQGKPGIAGHRPIFLAGGQIGLIVESYNSGFGFQSTQVNALRTNNGGLTWDPIIINGPGIPVQFLASSVISTPTKFVMLAQAATTAQAPNGAVSRVGSSDDGINWTWESATTPATHFRILAKKETLFVWGSTNTIFVSTNYGNTWVSRYVPAPVGGGVFLNGPNIVVLNNVSTSYISANDGVNWTALSGITVPTSQFGIGTGSQDGSIIMWQAQNDIRSFFSFDGGFTWEAKNLPANNFFSAAVVGGWLILNTGNGFTYRTRNGNTWVSGFINKDPANARAAAWRETIVTPDGQLIFSGSVLPTTGTFLISTDAYATPSLASPAAGTKLVVRAK